MRTRAALLTLTVLALVPVASLRGAADASAAHRRVVVRFAPGVSLRTETAVLAHAGARRVVALPALHSVVVSAGPGALERLRREPGVVAAEPDGRARALDLSPPVAESVASSNAWQVERPQLPQAWQVTTGPGIVVAVVDSGVQADHPALAGRVLPGHNFVTGTDDASDDNGHGTAVAGVIAAAGNGVSGPCTGCKILPVKVLDQSGTGDWGTIAAGIVWAADHGAQVINLSLGAPHVLDAVGQAIAYAESKGAIVVAAAGNWGVSAPFYPAAYPGVISVAGVDENDARYPWSNYGSWITIAAPGCMTTTWIGGGYDGAFCGTSTAAPFVAGLAALARSFRPGVSSTDFAAALARSAAPVGDGTAAGGRVDANGMLLALGAPATAPAATAAPSVAGTPAVGRALKALPGIWSASGSFTYTWQRSRDGQSWHDTGAAAAYVPRVADAGYRLRVVVDAANPRGSATATSASTAPIAAAVRVAGAHPARAKAPTTPQRRH